jgi:hypothetical protein
VINGTARTSVRELVEAKACAFCGPWQLAAMHGTRFATNGNTWSMQARAHKAVKQRGGAAAALDDAVFAGVPPPPIATQTGRCRRSGGAADGRHLSECMLLRKQLRFPEIAVTHPPDAHLRGVWPSTTYNDHAL